MRIDVRFGRPLAGFGLLLALAACTTADVTPGPGPVTPPPLVGNTNDPAPGFANLAPGSEEDFILNVGRRVFFTQGSATLDSVAKTTLDKQAAWLAQNPKWLVKLQGFADDSGSAASMVSLSQKRADAAMAYLVTQGVDSGRLWAKGYGKDRLVRDCPDTACKVQNRRVVSNLRESRDED